MDESQKQIRKIILSGICLNVLAIFKIGEVYYSNYKIYLNKNEDNLEAMVLSVEDYDYGTKEFHINVKEYKNDFYVPRSAVNIKLIESELNNTDKCIFYIFPEELKELEVERYVIDVQKAYINEKCFVEYETVKNNYIFKIPEDLMIFVILLILLIILIYSYRHADQIEF